MNKHCLSVFVADESGLINRVAGVFARRGANIESLAVGLTIDKALFTIVATGTAATVSNLCKQLAKLVNVQYVEDITQFPQVQRELVLMKVEAPPGTTRTEILQIVEIFRARVVDVSDKSLVIQATGDPGKIAALQRALGKFGMTELVRTGRIALKRGGELFAAGAAGNNVYPSAQNGNKDGTIDVAGSERVDNAVTETTGAALESVHDVFGGGANDDEELWHVHNVLDAAYAHKLHDVEPCTLCIEVEDVPGVLNQVTGVFARRGYNVQSLAVGNSEKEGMSRITMVAPGDGPHIGKLIKQLEKLAYVRKVIDLTNIPHVQRELMLIKVRCAPQQRGELMNLAQIFRGAVCDVSKTTVTLEVTGKEDKMRALQEVLSPYGILEVARTGRIALSRDSGVDSKFLKTMSTRRKVMV